MSQSLWVRDRFLIIDEDEYDEDGESQSLWVRDRFLMMTKAFTLTLTRSQSLWVRDRFLMRRHPRLHRRLSVAIPLGQGQVFNPADVCAKYDRAVAIPLGQGQVFNSQGCFFSLFSMCCRGCFQLLFL
ncbi:hypothetical protein HMPREF0198_0231 [Cardiobacterium hominis ATCC 15826]|uniref:Uncharacterized protein n=1 Tax=Cardiobacterium hominis (strain ATCC 15826 / DSM 8339 / NCTC 10426 / 6573) TaxID=638300 RepID=C8N6V5_CARH6|nr:hypothetical protein HMPREF0198_0231 [Cardiobacterium hominis ATCC 15826]